MPVQDLTGMNTYAQLGSLVAVKAQNALWKKTHLVCFQSLALRDCNRGRWSSARCPWSTGHALYLERSLAASSAARWGASCPKCRYGDRCDTASALLGSLRLELKMLMRGLLRKPLGPNSAYARYTAVSNTTCSHVPNGTTENLAWEGVGT